MVERNLKGPEVPPKLDDILRQCGYSRVNPYIQERFPDTTAHYAYRAQGFELRWTLGIENQLISARRLFVGTPHFAPNKMREMRAEELKRLKTQLQQLPDTAENRFLQNELEQASKIERNFPLRPGNKKSKEFQSSTRKSRLLKQRALEKARRWDD